MGLLEIPPLEDMVVLGDNGSQGVVRAAVREGATVVFTGRRSDVGEKLAADTGAHFVRPELSDPERARYSAVRAVDAHGRVDCAAGDVHTASALPALVDGGIAVVANSRHDNRGYDVRLEPHGMQDGIGVAAGSRTFPRTVADAVEACALSPREQRPVRLDEVRES